MKPFNPDIADKVPESLRLIGIIDFIILILATVLIQDYPTKEDFLAPEEENGVILDNERNNKTEAPPVRSKSRQFDTPTVQQEDSLDQSLISKDEKNFDNKDAFAPYHEGTIVSTKGDDSRKRLFTENNISIKKRDSILKRGQTMLMKRIPSINQTWE